MRTMAKPNYYLRILLTALAATAAAVLAALLMASAPASAQVVCPTPPAGSTYSLTVDNADSSRFYAKVGTWSTGSFNEPSGANYGTDYRYTRPRVSAYYAWYKVCMPTEGYYQVYAWWPATDGNNNNTVFWVWTSNGWVKKDVNQTTSGGQWVPLGGPAGFHMKAEDDWDISVDYRSSYSGTGNIIADAVKIEPV
jgi:hypothetical protein